MGRQRPEVAPMNGADRRVPKVILNAVNRPVCFLEHLAPGGLAMSGAADKAHELGCLAALAAGDLLPKERSVVATIEARIFEAPTVPVSVQERDGIVLMNGRRDRKQATIVSPIR